MHMAGETAVSNWTRYTDLAAKLLLPVALFGGSVVLSLSQQREAKFRACVEQQFKLAEFACKRDKCVAEAEGEAVQLAGLTSSVSELCKQADVQITKGAQAAVQSAVAGSNNVAQTADVARSVGAGQVVETPAASADYALANQTKLGVPADQTPTTDRSEPVEAGTYSGALPFPADPASPPPRIIARRTVARAGAPQPTVYVQIGEASQRQGADALIARLNTAQFIGTTLRALGPDLQRPVQRNELRCLKRESCAEAADLAAYIQAVLGKPVAVVNLSGRFQSNPAVRTWTYELWLAPGPLEVGGA
jgi:hypothetical protein